MSRPKDAMRHQYRRRTSRQRHPFPSLCSTTETGPPHTSRLECREEEEEEAINRRRRRTNACLRRLCLPTEAGFIPVTRETGQTESACPVEVEEAINRRRQPTRTRLPSMDRQAGMMLGIEVSRPRTGGTRTALGRGRVMTGSSRGGGRRARCAYIFITIDHFRQAVWGSICRRSRLCY